MLYLRLWTIVAIYWLVRQPESPIMVIPPDLALLERECDFLCQVLPEPRGWFAKWLNKKVLAEINRQRVAGQELGLLAKQLAEKQACAQPPA